ncbi:hypothetical protein JCM11251_004421 [Rhodosporidiobolus azoricus]
MLPHSILSDDTSAPPSYHSSTASSSQTSSPRTRPDSLAGSVVLDLLETDTAPSRPSTDSQAYSDSYDSAGEGTSSLASSVRSRLGGVSVGSSKDLHAYAAGWSGDEAAARYFPGSTASSRAHSPAPGGDGFDGYLSYRTTSRNRSRNTSGFSTPNTPADKEAYGPDFYTQHHHQTSALLRKLGGSLGPEASPVLGRSSRKPGWWARRAEARRKASISSSASGTPLLGSPALSRSSSRNKSTFSAFISALLRQPWFPTQPVSILFSLLLVGCFAATLTTFLVNVLSSDREPVPWRQYCQEQRPFPHALADSLKPVNVFVGVFTVDAAAERRNAIRLTYSKHSKPIDPRTGRPAQNVQLKFILGRPRKKWAKRIALEMEMFNDLVVLDVDENMNKGKTFKYFSWANENATVPVFYSTPGEEGVVDGVRQVGVGFRKADYVVKADDDTFIDLSELERHLRITPRENTYWGYLIRNRFMAGELYALSSDLVNHLATYERPKSWTIGKEDQRVAKWMRNHPNVSAIHWITERCYIYDHAKAGTPYARGFTFPDHVEQVRLEGRRGISEQERLRRGGELWQSWSTVAKWKKPYVEPAQGLSMEEQVEALVEGGGRWATQGWRSDNGRGPEAVKLEKVVFSQGDKRIVDPVLDRAGLADHPDTTATGAKPGAPDRSVVIPSARTTRFGKDLYRDPEGVEAVNHLRKRDLAAANVQEGPTRGPLAEGEHEIHNLVKGPFEDDLPLDETASSAVGNSSSSPSSPSSPPSTTPQHSAEDGPAYVNEPTAQIRIGQHAYALPSYNERFIPAPTLRYDPASLSIRKQRMLGLSYGGTVAVHYLKRNEWFFETALALLGRERMWDNGVDVPAYPLSPYSTNSLLEPYAKDPLAVSTRPLAAGTSPSSASSSTHRSSEVVAEAYPALWGSPRMYGSPIVLEDGMIVEGRRAEANREVVDARTAAAKVVKNEPVEGASWSGRVGRFGGNKPLVAVAEMDGVKVAIGGEEVEEIETTPVAVDTSSSPSSSSESASSLPSSSAIDISGSPDPASLPSSSPSASFPSTSTPSSSDTSSAPASPP